MSDKGIRIIQVKTSVRTEMVDITKDIVAAVAGTQAVICVVYTPHTTAGVTINENADPDVRSDVIRGMDRIVPDDPGYDHAEGNSPAHIKSSLTGCSLTVPVEQGKLLLGTWQGIFFCEFDGPRPRKVYVKVIEG